MKKIPLTSVVVATALSIPTVCAAVDSNDMANTKSSTPPSEASTTISKSESGPSKKAVSKKSKNLDQKKHENNEKYNKQKDTKDTAHLKSRDKKEKDSSDNSEYIDSGKRGSWDENDKKGMYLSMNVGAISIPTHPTLNIYEILTNNISALTQIPNQGITVTGTATVPPQSLVLNNVEIDDVGITSNQVKADLPAASGTARLDSFGLTGADVYGAGTASIVVPDRVIRDLGYVTVEKSDISSDIVTANLPANNKAVLNNISAFGINLNGGTGNASIPEAPISFSGLDSKGATIKTSTPGSIGLGAQEGSLTSLNINKANLKDGTLIADLPANNAKLTNFIAQGVKIEGGTSQGDVTIPKATSAQFQNLTTKNASIRTNYQGTNTIGLGTQTGTIDSLEINEAKLVSTEGLVSTNTYKVGFSSLSSSDTDLKAGATGKTLATVTIPEKKEIKIKDISIYDSTIEARDSGSSIHLAQQTASFQGPITLRDADIKEGAVTTTIPGRSMNLKGVSGTLNLSNGSGQESISGNVNVPGQSLSIPRQNGAITYIELTNAALNNGSLTADLPSNKATLKDIAGKATIDAGKELVGSGTSIISEVETDVSITVPKQNVNLNSLKIKDAKLTSDSINANIPARETTLDTIIFEEVIVKAKNDNNSIILTDSSITGGTVTSDLPSNTISLSGLSGITDIKTGAGMGATSSADVTISEQVITFPELKDGEATNIALNNVLLTSEEYGLGSPTFFAQLPEHSASIGDISGTVTLTSGVGASSSADINIPLYFGQATNLTFTGASLTSNSITADLPANAAIIENLFINNADLSTDEVTGSLTLSDASVIDGDVTTNIPGQTGASLSGFGITGATVSGEATGSLSLDSASITGGNAINTTINIPAQIGATLGNISGNVNLDGTGNSIANVTVTEVAGFLTGTASDLTFTDALLSSNSITADLPAHAAIIQDLVINNADISSSDVTGSLTLSDASVIDGDVTTDLPGQTGAILSGFGITGATVSGEATGLLSLDSAIITGNTTIDIPAQTGATLGNISGTVNLVDGTGNSTANVTVTDVAGSLTGIATDLQFTNGLITSGSLIANLPATSTNITGFNINSATASGTINDDPLTLTSASLSGGAVTTDLPGQTAASLSGFGITGATVFGQATGSLSLDSASITGNTTINIPAQTGATLGNISGNVVLDGTGNSTANVRVEGGGFDLTGTASDLQFTNGSITSGSLIANLPATSTNITGFNINSATASGTINDDPLTLTSASLSGGAVTTNIPGQTGASLSGFGITGATVSGQATGSLSLDSASITGNTTIDIPEQLGVTLGNISGNVVLDGTGNSTANVTVTDVDGSLTGTASDLTFTGASLTSNSLIANLPATSTNITGFNINSATASGTINDDPLTLTSASVSGGAVTTNIPGQTAASLSGFGITGATVSGQATGSLSLDSASITGNTTIDIPEQLGVTLGNISGNVVLDGTGNSTANVTVTDVDGSLTGIATDLTFTDALLSSDSITADLPAHAAIIQDLVINNADISSSEVTGSLTLSDASLSDGVVTTNIPGQTGASLSGFGITGATVSATVENISNLFLHDVDIRGRATGTIPAQSTASLNNVTGTINLANGTGTSSAYFTIPERNVTANNLSFTDASFEGKDFTVEMPIQTGFLRVAGPVNLLPMEEGDGERLIPGSSSSGDVTIPSQDITFPTLSASATNLEFTGASLSNMSIDNITIPGQTTQNLSGFGVTGATITGTSNEFVTLRDFSFESGVPTIGIPEHTSAALSGIDGLVTLDATVRGSTLSGDLSVPEHTLSVQKQSGQITSLKLINTDLTSNSLDATIPANPGAKLTTVSGTVDLKTGVGSSITGNVVVPSQSIAVAEQTGTIQSLTLRDAKLTDSSLNIDIPDATATLKDFKITGATMGGKADKIESTIPAGIVKVFAFSTEKAKIEGEKGQISLPKQEGVASDLYFENSDLIARNGDIQLYSTKNIPIIDIDVSRATITGKPKGSTITQANPGIAVTNLNISNAEAVATLGTIDLPEQTGNAKNISFNSTRIDATDTRADISGQNQVTLANYQVSDASLKGTPTDSTVKLPANDSLTLTKLSATNTEITASGNIRLSEQSGIVNNVAFNNASINPGDDKATIIADLPGQDGAKLGNFNIRDANLSGSATTAGATVPGDTITNLGEVRLSQANISSNPATTVTGGGTVEVNAQNSVPLSNFELNSGTVTANGVSVNVPKFTAFLNGDATIKLGNSVRGPAIVPGTTFDAPENPTYATELSKSDYIVPIADLNLGFHLSKNFRTEIGLSHLFKKNSVYNNTELYKNSNTRLPDGTDNAASKGGINVTRTINSKMNFFSVNAVGYYDFHNSSDLTPFIGLGLGYGFSRYSMDGATITKAPVTDGQSTEALETDKTSTRSNFSSKTSGNMNFSAHVGASYKLSNNVTLQGKLFLQSMGQFITTEPDIIHIQKNIIGADAGAPDTNIATQALQLKNKSVLSYGATAGIRISF